MVIKEFFANIAILVSFLFFYTQMANKYLLRINSSVKLKIVYGVLGGILCNVLMQYGIRIDSTIVDLRHIPTVLLAYYIGPIPALISMVMTIIGRFLIANGIASYFAIIISVSGTLFAIYFSRLRLSKKTKIISMLTFNNIVFTIIISYLVKDVRLILKVMPIYWVVSYISALLAFSVISYIRRSQKLFEKYQMDSITDSLTGLNNVRKFKEVYSQLLSDLESSDQNLSVLYLDIDHFKQVNDTYGHSEGDAVLKELGVRLQKCTRTFDIVSRNGGEEFTVLLLDCPLPRAVEIAERIRECVEMNPFQLNSGKQINLTISIGVSCYKETTKDSTMLINDADKALYQAKHSGRNQVCIANQHQKGDSPVFN